ncbi:MAG: DNA repair exonuclease [Aerococcaceae bacterium]|nr:DNA repair exonuclease [Aerococcaceae bacterium]
MKLMHVADLHLDSPFVGLAKQHAALQKALIQSPYQAFDRCVSIAINQAVDVMVIAGDVYDSERQTIYAQHFFLEQLKRLEKAGIAVILSHGNHDYLNLERKPIAYPENVRVFPSQEVTSIDVPLSNGESARFYGFSYTKRWVPEPMIEYYPSNRHETTYTIGCLHGSLDGTKGNYAPFSLEALKIKGYDYWALGHIHQAQTLSEAPLIQYSGTIQGRHRHETGDKGAYLIELKVNQPVSSQFISLAPIVWQNATVTCQSGWQTEDVLQRVREVIENYRLEAEVSQQSQLVELTLEQAQHLPLELQEQIERGELLLALNLSEEQAPFTVVTKVNLAHTITAEPFEYDVMLRESFAKASEELLSGEMYERVMQEVFQHSVMRQRLQEIIKDADFKREISQSARQQMIQAIGVDLDEEGSDEN